MAIGGGGWFPLIRPASDASQADTPGEQAERPPEPAQRDNRVTDSGDTRVTDEGDTRVTEDGASEPPRRAEAAQGGQLPGISGRGEVSVGPNLGEWIVQNRDQILATAPTIKEAVTAILDRYKDRLPNDKEQQEFVVRLRDLSDGIDDFVTALQATPTEPEADGAGKGLLSKFFDFIHAFEATKTGDRVINLAAASIILGLRHWFAKDVTPDLAFCVLSVAVFHHKGEAIADVIKTYITAFSNSHKK